MNRRREAEDGMMAFDRLSDSVNMTDGIEENGEVADPSLIQGIHSWRRDHSTSA